MQAMDIDDIRRTNLRTLEAEVGGMKVLADKAGMSYTQCLNYRNGALDSRSGKKRGMRKETAWRFEVAGNKPRGWLDQDHSSESRTGWGLASTRWKLHGQTAMSPCALNGIAAALTARHYP